MIWLAFAALMALALLVALPPLLSRRTDAPPRAENDLTVYRAQLAEVDADLGRGTISTAEAEAAKLEIQRRILALPDAVPPTSAQNPGRSAAIVVGAILCSATLATYLVLGHPLLPAHPYSARAEQEEATNDLFAKAEAMIATIEAKVKADPNNPTGWRLLGTIYVKMQRYKEGADALTKAIALDPNNAELHSQLGEALMQMANGKATPEAMAAFDDALKLDPKDPRARFYKGAALADAGKEKEALDAWIAIIRDGPPDAEWLPTVRSQARGLATKLKLDPNVVP